MQSRWKRWKVSGLAGILGALLWLSASSARAQDPHSTLRFFDNKATMIFHFNDLQASADDLLALSGRYGMDVTAQGLLQMGRMQLAQILRLQSMPKDWNETFSAVGLPTRPSFTLYLADMYSGKIPDIVGVVPLQSASRVLSLLKQTLPNYFAMQELRTCHRVCRQYRQAAQLYQVRYGKMPKDLQDLRRSRMIGRHKFCREVVNFAIQGDAVTCGGLNQPQAWIQKVRQVPPMSLYKDAYVMRAGKVVLALHKAGYALVATRQSSLRAAIDRFATQTKHPKYDTFVRTRDAKTRFQFFIDYRIFMKDAMKQQQEQMRQLRGLPFMDLLQKAQEYGKKYMDAYRDAWLLGRVHGDRYKVAMSMEIKGDHLPMIRSMKKLPLVSAMDVYKIIPRDTLMMFSGNFNQIYGEFAEELLKVMGPLPIKIPLKEWFAVLGDELAFSASASGQKMGQGALYVALKDPAAFDAKLMPLLARLEQELVKIKTTRLSKVQLPGATAYRVTIAASAKIEIDVAFARVGSFFVLTVEPTAGVALLTLRQILQTMQGKAPSLLHSPHFATALKKSPLNNGVMFMDIEKTAAKAQRYAPPLKGMQIVFAAMRPMSYAWAWMRLRPQNDISAFLGYLQMKSAKGTVETPPEQGSVEPKETAPAVPARKATSAPAASQPSTQPKK